MEMDYDLKKLANLFKFLLCILEKLLKTVCSSLKKSVDIFLPVLCLSNSFASCVSRQV